MTADDLNAPLGQQKKKRRLAIPITTSQVLGGALALFLGVFVLWAVLSDNPFGGEPMAVAKINPQAGQGANGTPNILSDTPNRYDGPSRTQPPVVQAAPAGAPKTVTIIDGKTGQRQDIELGEYSSDAAAP